MSVEYITVKEFAELANITQQAVYKQLNGKLKDRYITEGKKKMIDKSAVELFKVIEKPTVEQLVEQQLNNELLNRLQLENENLKAQIEEIKNDYKVQIDDLKKDKDDLKRLLDQQQKLHQTDQLKLLQIEEQKENNKPKKWWQKLLG